MSEQMAKEQMYAVSATDPDRKGDKYEFKKKENMNKQQANWHAYFLLNLGYEDIKIEKMEAQNE